MYGLTRNVASERTAELLEFMDLKESADKLVADYSHGMKKKTALAAAVIHGPAILFLDEPFEGVDAIAATTLKPLFQRLISHGGDRLPTFPAPGGIGSPLTPTRLP